MSRSHFMENKLVLSQFSGNIIDISRFTKTKWHILTQTYITYDIGKLRPSTALLDVFVICPLLVLCAAQLKSEQEHEEG